MAKPVKNHVESIQKQLNKHKSVVSGLKNTEVWNTLISEFLKTKKTVDSYWPYAKATELEPLRIQRSAIDMVLSILGYHESKAKELESQLAEYVSEINGEVREPYKDYLND